VRTLATLALLAAATSGVADAQIVPAAPPRQQQQPQPEDTVKVPPFRVEPPVSPLGAAMRSLLVPGWGQAAVDRHVTGAIFIFWEGLTLTMTIKSVHQLHYQEDTGVEDLEGKRSEVQDWAVLLAFNHLLAAAEAYVAANLWDFPVDLKVDRLPSGDPALGVRFYW